MKIFDHEIKITSVIKAILIIIALFYPAFWKEETDLSWPSVAFILIILFGDKIIKLIEQFRIKDKHGNLYGIIQEQKDDIDIQIPGTLEKTMNQNNASQPQDMANNFTAPEPPLAVYKPLIEENEAQIEELINNLRKRKFTDSQILEYAKRDLAGSTLALDFEKIFQAIFGSQIKLLQKLNTLETIPYSEVRDFYTHLEIPNYPLSDWINYMSRNNLLEIKGDNLIITKKGKAFAYYIEKLYADFPKSL